jgi:hypothetical protein
VKLFCGMLYSDPAVLEAALEALGARYGAADHRSDPMPFTATEFYAPEMGGSLYRVFTSYRDLIDPAGLPGVKLETNRIEQSLREGRGGAGRPVNLDPGYLSASKIVLASTKNYAHRLYLGDGIYGEIEFFFKRQGIACLEWTYRDYRSEAYHRIFLEIRRTYLEQIKDWTPPPRTA